MVPQVLPILLLAASAIGLSVALVMAGQLLGPRRSGAVKAMPYESGMDPIHDARRRFDVRFYLVAVAFLIFDVELLFLYPWAVARTNPEGLETVIRSRLVGTGSAGLTATGFAPYRAAATLAGERLEREVALQLRIVFVEVLAFIGLLALGLVYAWRKGVFQWR
jgi:NADH-quinone oxidoreductase subunit A